MTTRLALVGWALWLLSLITPDVNFESIGVLALIESVYFGAASFGTILDGQVMPALFGVVLLLGAASNITLFVWTPRWLSLIVPCIPLVTLGVSILIAPNHLSPFGSLFFYPWATGIALVHIARLQTKPYPDRPGASQPLREASNDRVA